VSRSICVRNRYAHWMSRCHQNSLTSGIIHLWLDVCVSTTIRVFAHAPSVTQRDFDKFAELAEGYGMQLPEELEEFRTKRPKAPRRKLVKPPVLKIPKTRPRQGEDDYEGVEEEEKEFDPQPPRKKRPIVKRVVTYHEEGEEVSASEAEEEAPAPRSRPREERTPPSKFSGKNLPPKRPVSLPSRHEGIGAHSREAYIDDPIGTNPPQRREVQKPAGRAYMGEADGPIREVQRTFKWV